MRAQKVTVERPLLLKSMVFGLPTKMAKPPVPNHSKITAMLDKMALEKGC